MRTRLPHFGSQSAPVTPLARTFIALTGSQVLGKVIRFGYILVIARLLGPEDTAIYIYGLAVYIALCIVASFGQGIFLATRLGRGARTRRAVVRHSLTMRLLSTCLAVALGAVFLLVNAGEPLVRTVLAVFLCALVARSLSDWLREWSTALEDAAWIPRYELVFRGSEAFCGTLLLLQGGGVLEVSIVHLVGRSLEAVAATRLMRNRRGPIIGLGGRRRLLRRIAAVSLALATGAGCLALFPQVSVIALKRLVPELAELAYFGIGLQVLMTLMVFPTVLATALLPAIGRVHRGCEAEVNDGLSLLIRIALLSGLAIAVLAEACTASVIDLLLGQEYAPVVQVLTRLAWILGPYAALALACQSLNAIGARLAAAVAGIALVALGLAAMVLAVPASGLFGAILSFALAVLVTCGFVLHQLRPYVAQGESRAWLQVLILTAGLWALLQLDLAPTLLMAPLALSALALLSWWLGLLRGSEVLYVLRRFGFKPPHRRRKKRADLDSPPSSRDLAV